MSPDAWAAIGVAVTAIAGVMTTIIVEGGRTRRALLRIGLSVEDAADAGRSAASNSLPVSNGAIPEILRRLQCVQATQERTIARMDAQRGALDRLGGQLLDHIATHDRRST